MACYNSLYRLLFKLLTSLIVFSSVISTVVPPDDLVIELTDDKWDQIQKGQWLIGFFDRETESSLQLEKDWKTFAMKCKTENINVGKIFAPKTPGLDVRFLVTTYPKVFYVKNGVAHEIPKVSREILMSTIRDKKWGQLKPVGFLTNPFSVQMSLLSHLFIHAVNLYNYEDAIVQKFVPFASATDIAFGLTFIIVGTSLGLFIIAAVSVIQILFFSSKDSEDSSYDEKEESDQEKEKEEETEDNSEESKSVRKRKK
ncbi:thioredoxin-related transmembrane protein 4 [Parasteatoda tepidariorum]|uniref:thioredoxin-related transmembrane protein 4 n=1 Tax=Parasteatoda tepidariorum TaxID=114398 RepID=UPI00077F8AEA|nr:thioredoxin-related transmembrane protein 4 [Parasteatoda tepidariorum]